ncbi:hypothetical protein [Salinimicrobium flavum]|uniref:Uncharacterized protein n=1 Tax=Salinimicrobium flavum TaxID=1737065 RepID=A0ABW5IZ16_9FLAO
MKNGWPFLNIHRLPRINFALYPDFSGEHSQPEFFAESNNYPTRYNIYEDSKTGDIYISLSDFVAR